MRYQEALSIMSMSLADLEARLANVENWPAFLSGVESVSKICHERYRFVLVEGRVRREATIVVRHARNTHTFTWRALDGPGYVGRIELRPIDARHTRVKLTRSSVPTSLGAGIAEMVMPQMSRVAHELRELEAVCVGS